MKIVIIGGTGLIGSKVVALLGEHGHEAVAAAPNTGVNTLTGEGLAEVMKGANVVVDVSNSPSFEDAAVMEFFTTSTRNLLAAENEAGVGHHVVLSVVGSDRRPDIGYFRAKTAQERLVRESSIPFSILHATQFYEFGRRIADEATTGNEVHIAPVAFQPIAGDDVARTVARTAAGAPLNALVEIAGPNRYRMDEFFRKALAAWGDPREVVTDPQAHYFGAVPDESTLVPAGDAILGEIAYRDWLQRSGA
ncbi:SDR family oxidoreductase [Embleya sp. MST-111070]|uniref:SDR family oxidoreductase n=1 Tax=Embleya sp. MST-111070 TaxID=3398231 RepID=UPI003F731301